ncbi:MAG TPA: glycosyltransferase family 4 protein, partial [Roseiflexaceae bacterium]|nr:glycosyltransferase family 4 protein [Roseiflexaceae bacterium]
MHIVIAQRVTLAHGIRGGMETQAQSLATGLAARGHTVQVLTTPVPKRGDPAADTLPTRYVVPGTYRRYRRAWWEACRREVQQLRQQQRVDVLLSHSAGALGYLRWAEESGIPTVVVMHGTPLSEIRNQLSGARTPRSLYRLVRTLIQIPGHVVRWRDAAQIVRRWIMLTPIMAQRWSRESGAPRDRMAIIPNGIDVEHFRPDAVLRTATRAAYGLAADAPLLVAVGRLEREKGLHIALEAFTRIQTRFPAARLIIAGQGSDRPTLVRQATASGAAVMLPGYIANQDLPGLLAAADLFLMPSLCDEAFPLTIIEAL